jgi:hypothetical protein
MKQLDIKGPINDSAVIYKAIAEAIQHINFNNSTALTTHYIGVKIYAGFGYQREDHEYGRCPRHGSIVFSIGRRKDDKGQFIPLDKDSIYLLECIRDAGDFEPKDDLESYNGYTNPYRNLAETLQILSNYSSKIDVIKNDLKGLTVENHQIFD